MAATFSLIGTIEPFLHCNLKKGDSIYCEANAMVMMESNLELKGKLQGGLMQSLMRRFANDESLFQQQIEAVNGEGDCLLAPTLDGDMQIIDCGAQQYTLSDGAFVAAQTGIDIRANIQRNLGGAVFADKDVIIDNGHVGCWDSNLDYKLSVSTSKKKGIMSNIINSVTSGEGMVLNFSGTGKVIICSRNRDSYQGWLQSILGTSSGGRGGSGGFLDNIL